MNDSIVFGQYIYRNSFMHKLDARVKLIALVLIMVGVFLIPKDHFILLGIAFLIPLLAILFSKISLFKYLKSLKQIAFVMLFSFVFQLIGNHNGALLLSLPIQFTIVNIAVVVLVFIIYFLVRKYLPFKFLIFVLLLIGATYLFRYPIYGHIMHSFSFHIYQEGVIHGLFLIGRVFVIILASTSLTLTTKPTDLTNALEWLLKPLERIKIKTSIFAMMISIALRSIPTLFNETNRILKAQASRGADFNESNLKEQIGQMVSLLVPMFVISIKKAEDLADAMEARGYIPGEKRTRLVKMTFKVSDYMVLGGIIILFILLILGKCGIYAL
ncbi:MAG: energy-coupling factor transporter transmembrane protein EcfT [Prevotella sp.]|nr:energy-coupling factor transporter transmembrane protein EcfT [Staphylococcus sp.]MCM1350735.1 energy-coupling factor transporter transmembrane protein EcfT [Prevotella sp.]